MKRYKDSILYIIIVVIAIVLSIVKLQPEALNLYHIETGIRQKTAQLSDLDRQLQTLKAAELKKDTQTAMFEKKIYKPGDSGLDTEASFSIMFDDLIEMAKYNSVKIYSIAYTYNPATDAFVKGAPSEYNVCQVNMQMIADYVDFNEFLKAIYKYPYLVCVDEVELKPYTKNKRILLINLQLKLYATSSGTSASKAATTPAGTSPTAAPGGSTATSAPSSATPGQTPAPASAPSGGPAPSAMPSGK